MKSNKGVGKSLVKFFNLLSFCILDSLVLVQHIEIKGNIQSP